VSMLTCPAVHIPTRSLLRSSSTPEPSDPLHSVVTRCCYSPPLCRIFGQIARSLRRRLTKPARGVRLHSRTAVSRAASAGTRRGPPPPESNVGKPRTPVRTPDEGSGGPGEDGQPTGTTTTSAGSSRVRVEASPLRQTGRNGAPGVPTSGTPRPGAESSVSRSVRPTDSPSTANDPTAGSPTVTLLRLLLPLNAQVWKSSRAGGGSRPRERPAPRGPVQMPH
jgi:hypothetical protein